MERLAEWLEAIHRPGFGDDGRRAEALATMRAAGVETVFALLAERLAVPDAEARPGPEPPMGRAPGAAQLLGDILPSGAGGQDEPDHSEGCAVPDPGTTALGPDGLLGRQMMGDGFEEFVRHMGGSHNDGPQTGRLWTHGANLMPRGVCQSLLT